MGEGVGNGGTGWGGRWVVGKGRSALNECLYSQPVLHIIIYPSRLLLCRTSESVDVDKLRASAALTAGRGPCEHPCPRLERGLDSLRPGSANQPTYQLDRFT